MICDNLNWGSIFQLLHGPARNLEEFQIRVTPICVATIAILALLVFGSTILPFWTLLCFGSSHFARSFGGWLGLWFAWSFLDLQVVLCN